MPIKTILETLDGVPEGLHEFYKETDSGFCLDVEDIDQHPDVSNLRKAYQSMKDSERKARADYRELQEKSASLPEDFDPELWNKAKSGELEKGLVKIRERLEADLSTAQKQLAESQQQIRTMTVDRALGEALDAANITTPAYRKAATVLLRDAVKLDGTEVVVDSDMGPLKPVEFVKKWASTDEGKPFVTAPSGGGSRSGEPGIAKGPKSWADAQTREEKLEFIRNKQTA